MLALYIHCSVFPCAFLNKYHDMTQLSMSLGFAMSHVMIAPYHRLFGVTLKKIDMSFYNHIRLHWGFTFMGVPSGKRLHSYRHIQHLQNSLFSTVAMAIFNSKLYSYDLICIYIYNIYTYIHNICIYYMYIYIYICIRSGP